MPDMADLSILEDVRGLSVSDISKLKNDQLKTALTTVLHDSSNGVDKFTEAINRLDGKFDTMKNDIVIQLRSEIKSVKDDHDIKLDKLRDENKVLRDCMMQHQRYLESLESQKRVENIFIFGVSESENMTHDNVTATNDKEKCSLIFNKIGCQVQEVDISRLGREPEHGRPAKRPIKVQLRAASDRAGILDKAKTLKDAGEMFSRIYIKKDQHLAMVRREFARLNAVVREEKDKAENVGKRVEFDRERRFVVVDGVVIDQFKVQFF